MDIPKLYYTNYILNYHKISVCSGRLEEGGTENRLSQHYTGHIKCLSLTLINFLCSLSSLSYSAI